MKTLIVITAIYLLLTVLVIALCKARTMADKKAKEIFKDKTNDSKINQHRADT